MGKLDFDEELSQIGDSKFRLVVSHVVQTYLNEIKRMSSADHPEHHPLDEFVAGGLILHCKRVAWMCCELCKEWEFDNATRDAMIAAAILHDIGRAIPVMLPGDTVPARHKKSHGQSSVNLVRDCVFRTFSDSDQIMIFEMPRYNLTVGMMLSHMAHWDESTPMPESLEEKMFATADYIVSRNTLTTPVF